MREQIILASIMYPSDVFVCVCVCVCPSVRPSVCLSACVRVGECINVMGEDEDDDFDSDEGNVTFCIREGGVSWLFLVWCWFLLKFLMLFLVL